MITFLVINGILFGTAIILIIAERLLISYGECSIVVNKERKIPVEGGDNLLVYLNDNKIFIPSACGGKATCGFCKVTVKSGAGQILPTEEPFINKKERGEGVRLACQVKVKGKVDIQIPEFMLSAEEFESVAEKVVDVTPDTRWIILKILGGKTINFKPGQYIQIKIPGTDEFRAYSIASPPYITDKVHLTIRLVPGGLCSTFVHKALEEGDHVTFTGSFGDFFLQEDSTKEIVCIGGGCGMAPIRSIVQYLAKHGMPRKCWYFFGARSKRDLFFTEELRDIEVKFPNFKYVPALSEPKAGDHWEGDVGLITHVVEKYLDAEAEKEAYLCGPPPMIDAAMHVLPPKNIKPESIYFDKF